MFQNTSSTGAVAFTPTSYATGPYPLRAVVVDLDGVNGPDLVVPNQGPNPIFLNQGGGTFAPSPTPPGTIFRPTTVADFDHDGSLDILYCFDATRVAIYYGVTGTPGTFEAAATLYDVVAVSPTNVGDILAVDADGDGNADILVTGSTGLCVLYGDGARGFGKVVTCGCGPAPGIAPLHITVGDVNEDGRLDVGVNAFGGGGFNVFFGRR